VRPRRFRSPIDEHVDVGEEVRLKYRYLDLRRTAPNHAIRLRSNVNKAARDVLDDHGFVEVETPTLTRSTPRAPATSWCRPAPARQLVRAARRARSCSSSC
jgi:aspartyl-tRNA synthetase